MAGVDYGTATEQLLAPGSIFEMTTEDVLGQPLAVFKNRAGSLRQLVEMSAGHGDAEYFVFDGGRRMTFAEHRTAVATAANALQQGFGIEKGDRVAILAANCPEWIITYWATVSLGAVVVALNGWWAADEIRYGLDSSELKLLIIDQRRLARLGESPPDLPTVVIEADFDDALLATTHTELPDVAIAEDDPAVLLFTSGTTGRPKAALISHRNIIGFVMLAFFIGARTMMVDPPSDERPATVLLAVFPLFHVSGLYSVATSCLAGGVKSVWVTGRFEAGRVIELTRAEGITNWNGASTQIFRLLDHPDLAGLDCERVTSIGIGGSATTQELIRATEEKFPHLRGTFSSGYGLTESGALISHATYEMLADEPTSVGPPLPGVEVAIVDDTGQPVAEGGEGNICVRSALVMLEYWRDPAATDEALLAGRWLKTGDIGYLRNGQLHLASRQRDLIIRAGENVYPAEIEHRLEEHPGVAEAAVFGVDQRELGQEVKAIVVAKPGVELDSDELRSFVAESLAYFKVPAHVEIRSDPLPRNAAGKVLKRVLSGDAENAFVEE